MTLSLLKSAFASTASQNIGFSSFLSVTNDGQNPAYLVVNGLDRNEYTVTGTGRLGSLTGNGATAGFTAVGGDARGLGIVFTWNAASGAYVNATYGNLLNLTFNSSASPNELAALSFYGSNSAASVSAYGGYLNNASAMCQLSNSGSSPFSYLGTATVATQSIGSPSATTQPAQATPGSICTTALQFQGATWNLNGCWVLASTIDTLAGAALPVSSSFAQIPGQASGEWKIAYNGPVSSNANWQSLLRPGDQVALITGGGSGHITTVVSGTGASCQLLDNIDYGTNLARDGSANDLIIAGPHAASQEFTGANPATAVIYRLDTPVVTASSTSLSLYASSSLGLGGYFSANDWAGTAITGFQAYDSSATNAITLNGVSYTSATSATSCVSFSSLSSLGYLSGAYNSSDTVYVRAVNASGYWGDWTSLGLTVAGKAPPPAPTLGAQTATQTVYGGQVVHVSIASAFTDPSGLSMTYAASLASGAALPSWLHFDGATGTFSGTAPATAQTLALKVTATNSGGAATSETFSFVDKKAPPPTIVARTGNQMVYETHAVGFSVASAFHDPAGETLAYRATLSNGQPLPSWLSFDGATGTFSGTAPATAQTITVKVTASDAGGGSVSETFAVTNKLDTPVLTARTPSRIVYAGHGFAINAGAAFTDPVGDTMRYAATLSSGAALPGWVSFDSATGILSGTASATPQTMTVKVTATNTEGSSLSETFTLADRKDVPVVAHHTAAQTVYVGYGLTFGITSAFSDPAGEALRYAATLSTGKPLPGWLSFNAATGTFSATGPATPQSLSVKVTATNSGGASIGETVTVNARYDVPVIVQKAAAQTVYTGHAVSFGVATAFADPAGATLTYRATLTGGAALPSWLHLDPTTGAFTGTAPATAQTLKLTVTATNTGGRSVAQAMTLTAKQGTVTVSGLNTMAAVTPETVATGGLPAFIAATPQGGDSASPLRLDMRPTASVDIGQLTARLLAAEPGFLPSGVLAMESMRGGASLPPPLAGSLTDLFPTGVAATHPVLMPHG